MTRAEAARLLALAAAYDQRTIGDADVHAWQQVLSDLTWDDAHAALILHYRATDERATPARIRAIARPPAAIHAKPVPLLALMPPELSGRGSEECRRVMTATETRNRRRRSAVLANPGLAQRLVTEGGYPKADMWNGFVPPEFDADGNRNQSRRRELLTELVTLAGES